MLAIDKRLFYTVFELNGKVGALSSTDRIILGIDPGLANTGWGVVAQQGSRLECAAYGCVSTSAERTLAERLLKIHDQIGAVVQRFSPCCVGIETVWFGQNITAAFATGQARGAALVACAEGGLEVGEFSPRQIKLAVVGTGAAEKEQVQYMVQKLLHLSELPKPDHASDALAAAICYTTHDGFTQAEQRMNELVTKAEVQERERVGARVQVDACASRRGGSASQSPDSRNHDERGLVPGEGREVLSDEVYRAWCARAKG